MITTVEYYNNNLLPVAHDSTTVEYYNNNLLPVAQ